MRVHLYQIWDQAPENWDFGIEWAEEAACCKAAEIWRRLHPLDRRKRRVYVQGFDFDTDNVVADILEEYELERGFDPRKIPEEVLVNVLSDMGEEAMDAPFEVPADYPDEE